MKELNFTSGGHPLEHEDFLQLLEAIANVTEGLGSWGDNNSPQLVSGCKVNTINATQKEVTAGWIFVDGELFKVTSGILFGNPTYIALEPQLSNNRPPKLYKDGTTNQVFQHRTYRPVGTSNANLSGVVYLKDLVSWGVSSFRPVGQNNQPSFGNGWGNLSGHQILGFRKVNDQVQIRGSITSLSSGWDETIFTLPAGYRPVGIRYFSIVDLLGNNTHIRVNPSGDVTLNFFPGNKPANLQYHLEFTLDTAL